MHVSGRVRIVIFTVGTEGDARPYTALGRGLSDCGHDVVIATSRDFEAFVRGQGLGFAPLTGEFLDMMRRNKSVMDRSQVAAVRMLVAETRRTATAWAGECIDAVRGADLVIGSGSVSLVAASVAEKLGIPFVRSGLQPLDPGSALALPLFRPPPIALPGPVNLLLGRTLRLVAWRLMRRTMNAIRSELDLPPYPPNGPWALPNAAGARTLYGFSRHVVPRQPEWPERIAMPGYFVLRQAHRYEPPAALERFLANGTKPIYIGFGSMVSDKLVEMAEIVRDAVRLCGRRAIVGSGWGALGGELLASDELLVTGSIPHDWLFPRVALAVHHCGAGTAAAAVRAGIPTVPVPFFVDQFFWGWRLGQLGVATARLERRSLTARRLADAILLAATPEMARRAAELGDKVRAEDGVRGAIDQLGAWGLLPRADASRLEPVHAADPA